MFPGIGPSITQGNRKRFLNKRDNSKNRDEFSKLVGVVANRT